MKFLSTRMHGVMDYLLGALLIMVPWMFGFANDSAQTMVPVVLGVGLILYSLITNYELSLIKAIPMPVHLGLDAMGALFLAASPFLFGFSYTTWIPHVTIGVVALLTVLCTESYPYHAVGLRHRESFRH